MSEILAFCHDPVQAGQRALKEGARIFTDIKMVEVGIVKKGHNSAVETMLGAGDDLAASSGITRTSAGVFALEKELSGAIIVIGTPVGFVNADKSKERLRAAQVPSISTVGTRGGTPIAVAAINEIINMHSRASRLSS